MRDCNTKFPFSTIHITNHFLYPEWWLLLQLLFNGPHIRPITWLIATSAFLIYVETNGIITRKTRHRCSLRRSSKGYYKSSLNLAMLILGVHKFKAYYKLANNNSITWTSWLCLILARAWCQQAWRAKKGFEHEMFRLQLQTAMKSIPWAH